MSVSLGIDWPDGKFEDVAIATLRGADRWAEEGRALGLQLLSKFHDFLVVEPDQVNQFIDEIAVFRDAMAQRGEPYKQMVETADRLLATFHRLKEASGWRASIG